MKLNVKRFTQKLELLEALRAEIEADLRQAYDQAPSYAIYQRLENVGIYQAWAASSDSPDDSPWDWSSSGMVQEPWDPSLC